jgi:DNA-binding beta-propeller fold protein YncE
VQNPPWSDCCTPAPPVIEFDENGEVVRAWGGATETQLWPRSEHGIFVDSDGNVWCGSMDEIVIKSTRDGTRLLTLGERLPPAPPGPRPDPSPTGALRRAPGKSNVLTSFGAPTDIAVDLDAHETYVSDGYGNRRIIVIDSETGAYKRHWGAYGEKPEDVPLPDYVAHETPIRHFRSPVHAVRLGNDGLVYVADRPNNRIQVFRKSGEFVKEAFLATWTLAMGSVWDLEFSPDADQTFLYVPDGTNCKVWILTRKDLQVVGNFGRGGRMAGQFEWVHNLAADSKGNVYTSEVNTGKRIQKFVLQ